jgi:phosphatidylserine decarboxylase
MGTGMGMGMNQSLLMQALPQFGKLDFSGSPIHLWQDLEVLPNDGVLKVPHLPLPPLSAYPTKFSQQPLVEAAAGVGGGVQKTYPSPYPARQSSSTSSDAEHSSGSGSGLSSEDIVERLINVRNCPICHCPQLNKKAEMDITTHVAVYVSGDWAKINKIVVGNFITASQVQKNRSFPRVLVGIIYLGRCVLHLPFLLFECAV